MFPLIGAAVSVVAGALLPLIFNGRTDNQIAEHRVRTEEVIDKQNGKIWRLSRDWKYQRRQINKRLKEHEEELQGLKMNVSKQQQQVFEIKKKNEEELHCLRKALINIKEDIEVELATEKKDLISLEMEIWKFHGTCICAALILIASVLIYKIVYSELI